jgi:hypothetical protein
MCRGPFAVHSDFAFPLPSALQQSPFHTVGHIEFDGPLPARMAVYTPRFGSSALRVPTPSQPAKTRGAVRSRKTQQFFIFSLHSSRFGSAVFPVKIHPAFCPSCFVPFAQNKNPQPSKLLILRNGTEDRITPLDDGHFGGVAAALAMRVMRV